MAHKTLSVEGLEVNFRNVPGSGITRVSIAGEDAFGFDPADNNFVQFIDKERVVVTPDLPDGQRLALVQALVRHCEERERSFEAQGKQHARGR